MASMLAAVKVDTRRVEVQEVPEPEVAEDSALLRVDAAGMCGAFAHYARSGGVPSFPGMNGHENAGIIVKAGKIFQERHGVSEGDMVAMEEYLPCGHCEWCRIGEFRHCWLTDTHNNPEPTRLRGGYSQFLYLPPNSVLHKVPSTVTADEAALALPLGNGVQWAVVEGEAGPGKTIVIQGPGSKGLGCTLAAKQFGASTIIVSGLTNDAARFEAAKRLGADHTIDVQKQDFVSTVMEITDGRGADAVIDCARANPGIFMQAVDILKRRGGIVVTQSYQISDFPLEKLTGKYATLRACRGHSYSSVATGLEWIVSGKHPLTELMTHHYPLERTGDACLASGGEGDDADAVWVMVNPWTSS